MKYLHQKLFFIWGILFLSQCSGSNSDFNPADGKNPPDENQADSHSTIPIIKKIQQKNIQDQRPACSQDGWCFASSYPQGNLLRAVWTSPSGTAWAAGTLGALLHFNGKNWLPVSGLPKEVNDEVLYAIWGSSDTDVWVVGSGGLALHFDGTAWSVISTGVQTSIFAIWGASSDNVWATADDQILHWDGKSWALQYQVPHHNTLNAIFGSSPDNVWAVGVLGDVVHYDGTTWSEIALQTNDAALLGVWTSSKIDVWISGGKKGKSFLSHFDGQTWTSVDLSTGNEDPNVWIDDSQFFSPDGTGKELWLLGKKGLLFHKTDKGWGKIQLDPAVDLWSISGNKNGFWIAGGSGILIASDGKDFWQYSGLRPTDVQPSRIWVKQADPHSEFVSTWGISKAGILTRSQTDGKWSLVFEAPAGTEFFDIQGTQDELWVVGQRTSSGSTRGMIWHMGIEDYPFFEATKPTVPIHVVVAYDNSNVWFGGENGTLLHYDSDTYIDNLKSVTIADAGTIQGILEQGNDVWVLGEQALYHADLTKTPLNFTQVSLPFGEKPSLRNIWGTGSEVWITSKNGLFHYNSLSKIAEQVDLSSITTRPEFLDLQGIWGSGPNDIWVAGEIPNVSKSVLNQTFGTLVLHFDGKIWTKQESLSDADGPFQVFGVVPNLGMGPDPSKETILIVSPSVLLTHQSGVSLY